jgi:hypothetical protein
MNEIGVITFIVLFSLRLAVPFGLLILVGSLVQRRQSLLS